MFSLPEWKLLQKTDLGRTNTERLKKKQSYIFRKWSFISETIWSSLKRLPTKNLGYVFGVWRMLHPASREEGIPEIFLPSGATREDLLECCWQLWGEGLCILCCFLLVPWELVPVCVCICLKSAQEVWVMRVSVLDEFQGPVSMGQTMGQEQCRMLAIVWKSGAGGKDVYWPSGKEANGLGSGREMGKDFVTQLSFRISLASCICLTSKVPGHDPVW